MIPLPYYATVYHLVIAILTLALCLRLLSNTNTLENKNINNTWCIIFLLTTILFIGLRDPYVGSTYLGDTGAYTRTYQNIGVINIMEQKEIGFYALMKFCSYFLSVNLFYLLCAFLYIYPVYITFKKWFANYVLYALVVYIVSMSFWAFGINCVRNGLAVSFFIFSLGFTHKKWLMILIMLLSISFHKSMLLPVIAFFISFFFKKTNILIAVWIGCIIVSYLLKEKTMIIIEPLFGRIDDTRVDIYSSLSEELSEFTKGFRFDFVLYSAVPIILGWYYTAKKKYSDLFYKRLLNTYIIVNAAWILFFMYAPFTDRFAFLSWCIMPVVIVYPLLKMQLVKNQYRFINYLILGNLAFTLIMFFK